MFVKYGKGKQGIVDYLKYGQSKSRDYDREALDERIIVDGGLNQLDFILNSHKKSIKKNNNGDNYKHFVINFKENELSIDIIKKITLEFKDFAKKGYKDDELYFYAEIHYPKLKGYVFKNGEFNNRKPHVHVIIPVYNLYTGNKQYNFNYKLFEYDKYLSLFSKQINYKYNLDSPFEVENKKLLKNNSQQINRKNNKTYINESQNIKELILNKAIDLNIKSTKEMMYFLLNDFSEYKPQFGKINNNLIILTLNNKIITLKDFGFQEEFLNLSLDKKKALYEKHKGNYQTDGEIYNSALNNLEEKKLSDYDFIAKKIKYSKYMADYNTFKVLDIDEQKKVITKQEIKFYKEIYNNGYNQRTNNRIINSNIRATKIALGELKFINEEQSRINKSISLINKGKLINKKVNNYINTIPIEVLIKALEIKYGIKNPKLNRINNNYFLEQNIKNNIELIEFKNILYSNKLLLNNISSKNISKISNYYSTNISSNKILDEFLTWKNYSKVNKLKYFKKNIYDEIINTSNNNIKFLQDKYLEDQEKIIIKYQNLTKLKNIELKKLKISLTEDIDKIEESKKTYLKHSLIMKKENVLNGTIVGNDFIDFLINYSKNNKNEINDIYNYVSLVDIFSNKKRNITDMFPEKELLNNKNQKFELSID